jgi:hypothetical protein
MTKEQSTEQRMIASAKEALAFVQGEENGCVVHIPDKIDTARIRRNNLLIALRKPLQKK